MGGLVAKVALGFVMAGVAAVAFRGLTGSFVPSRRGALWWVLLLVLWFLGGAAIVSRFTGGLGAMTHLSDTFPWGIWIAFDVLCGVALAAGGFLVAGAVHIFKLERFRPVLRPTILTAYLGYLLVVGGLLMDLGRPYNIWHPIIYWQHHSVMFEVGWCVTLYTLVLTIEFLPILLEKLRWVGVLRILRAVTIPVVIAGIILSTLHQSSLGALFLIVPNKLLPLWYSPMLPLLFFVSATASGLAMIIVESSLSAWGFKKSLENSLVRSFAGGLALVLEIYILLRVVDITVRNGWVAMFDYPVQGFTFAVEMVLLTAPVLIIFGAHRETGGRLELAAATSAVLGVVLNRLNVAWFGMIPSAGVFYVPSWQEVVVTLNLVSYGVVVFALAVKYLPLFEHPGAQAEAKERKPADYAVVA